MNSKDEHWIIDVGNTRTKLVMFTGDEITSVLTDEAAIAFAENALNSGELPDQCMLAASGEVSHDWEEWIAQCNKALPKERHAFTLKDANDAGILSRYESMQPWGSIVRPMLALQLQKTLNQIGSSLTRVHALRLIGLKREHLQVAQLLQESSFD